MFTITLTIQQHDIKVSCPSKELNTIVRDYLVDNINDSLSDLNDSGTVTMDGVDYDWDIEACVSVSENIMEDYHTWWYNEGSGLAPFATEGIEEHVHRVSGIAWSNGSYKTSENAYLLAKIEILEKHDSVVFENEQIIYQIFQRDDGDYEYSFYNFDDFIDGDELNAMDGGICTGSAKDAVFMVIGN